MNGWERNTSVDPLYEKIEKYMKNSVFQAKKRMTSMLEKKYAGNRIILEQLGDYLDRMERAMDDMLERVKNDSKVLVEGSPLEELFMKNDSQFSKESKLKSCLQNGINVFFRIIYILRAVSECQRNGHLIIEKEVYDHYRLIYDNPKPDDNVPSDLFTGELHSTVQTVADFYNNPESEGDKETTNREKLRQMLQFVQDYYYYNRIRKNNEEIKDFGGAVK